MTEGGALMCNIPVNTISTFNKQFTWNFSYYVNYNLSVKTPMFCRL